MGGPLHISLRPTRIPLDRPLQHPLGLLALPPLGMLHRQIQQHPVLQLPLIRPRLRITLAQRPLELRSPPDPPRIDPHRPQPEHRVEVIDLIDLDHLEPTLTIEPIEVIAPIHPHIEGVIVRRRALRPDPELIPKPPLGRQHPIDLGQISAHDLPRQMRQHRICADEIKPIGRQLGEIGPRVDHKPQIRQPRMLPLRLFDHHRRNIDPDHPRKARRQRRRHAPDATAQIQHPRRRRHPPAQPVHKRHRIALGAVEVAAQIRLGRRRNPEPGINFRAAIPIAAHFFEDMHAGRVTQTDGGVEPPVHRVR